MEKIKWQAGCMLGPNPVVMVSCGNIEKPNIITLAWAGTINSEPPMLSISVRKERYSYNLIKESGDFVVNLVDEKHVKECDFCGVKSGKDVNKFKECGLTVAKSHLCTAPSILELPVNIECKVKGIVPLGSHDMFLGEVLSVSVAKDFLDDSNRLALENAGLVAYMHGEYFQLGKILGKFGFSVKKKNN